MKRAETNVISAPFFQLNKGTHNFHNINAAEYLLYGVLSYQNKVKWTCNLARIIEFKVPLNLIGICYRKHRKITWHGLWQYCINVYKPI